jgi:phosphoglycolate phosphatase-like HAD superfamily hydrolase
VKKLVLFDIDGTILWSDGAGRRAMEGALTEIFGSVGPSTYRYDGKTDRQIVRELMRADGHADDHIDGQMPRLLDAYLERLAADLEQDVSSVRLLDGVAPLLDALEARGDVVLGLLTGNVERGARAKLRAAGVDFERFKVNAFGSDHEHRPELPAVAQRRMRESFDLHVTGDAMIVIGDTPADIECGRSLGARAIGVATGRFSVEQLAEHSPAAVFPTLADTVAVIDAIVAPSRA